MCDDDASLDIFDYISEINPEALSIDGYDDCIIGLCHMRGEPTIIAYDKRLMIDNLVIGGMKHSDAEDYFENSILNDNAGEHAPVFITRLDGT